MRLIVSYSKFATSKSGGARESLLTLLNGAAETHEISADVYQTYPIDDPPNTTFDYQIHRKNLKDIPKLTWINQVANRSQWKRYLRSNLTSRYDLLITQNQLAPVSVEIANEFDIPSLCFVRSMALTGYEKYSPNLGHLQNLWRTDLGGRIQYPFLWKNFHDYRRAAQNATRTIANSEFTAGKIEELFGTDSTVIYPPIKTEKYRVQYNCDGYITMVNPRAEYKGPDIFLNIANRMSDKEFLLVGPIGAPKIKRQAKRLPNVTHWEWCEDMRDAYSEAKVVVVPSRWEEPFGRVPAEAMVSGIPCVVSSRGGLPEVVGNTGEIVTELEMTEHWIRAIHRALELHDPEAQKRRVKQFSAKNQVQKFQQMLDEISLNR
jgi:glycosyltransferase involved in cell wall biosynthesis